MLQDPLRLFWSFVTLALFSVAIPVLGTPLVRSARRSGRGAALVGLYLIGVVPPVIAILDALLPGQGTVLGQSGQRIVLSQSEQGIVLSQSATLLAFALIAFVILGSSQPETGRRTPALVVWAIGYGLMLITSTALNGGFDPRLLILPGLAFVVGRAHLDSRELVQHLRYIGRVTTFGSLYLFVQFGSLVMVTDNGRTLLGQAQLAGATSHPNVLGPVAALAMAVELAPGRRRRSVLGLAAAAACVLLAQSWAGLLAAAVVLLVMYLAGPRAGQKIAVLVLAIGTAFAVALIVSASFAQRFDGWDLSLNGLHGRTGIWRIALSVFDQHRIIGAGADAFSPEFRATVHSPVASIVGQAHNQVLETLAVGGVLGAIFLVGFVVAAIVAARRLWPSVWVAWAALAVLFVNSLSESPIRGGLILPTFEVLAVISLLLVRQEVQVPPAEPGQARVLADRHV